MNGGVDPQHRSRGVVVVHERFTERGGAESVVEVIASMTGADRILAPLFDPRVVDPDLAHLVRTGLLQRLYRGGTRYEHLLPMLPSVFAGMEVGDAELVVVSHHAFANRVRVRDGIPVVSYTHTPARWMWDERMLALEDGGGVRSRALGAWAARQRASDWAAARRPDVIVVNSTTVAERVEHWWHRSSIVVPPPVDTVFFSPDPSTRRERFFLWAGRLVPYKRPEVAVLAARAAGVPLVVAGDGRARPSLEPIAGPDTTFLGRVSRPELRHLFRTCCAVVFPGEEDFGIVPVEALACGTPVLALDAGGVRDTVLPGAHGVLVDAADRSTEALVERFAAAMRSMPDLDPASLRARAEHFSTEAFRERFRAVLAGVRSTGGAER